MKGFYPDTLKSAVDRKLLSVTDRVLVVCGGPYDRDVLLNAGFEEVTVTNLSSISVHGGEENSNINDYHPYCWEYQDAENLSYDDDSFDYVIVRDGLHHCASPHRAVCEMIRVARKGIVAFEARDSLLMRLAVHIGLSDIYELAAVAKIGAGGVRNSRIPNAIYRWTEREFEKTVNSYIPQYQHDFAFFYGYRAPGARLEMSSFPLKSLAAKVVALAIPLLERVAPRQGNSFAMFASKRGRLQPWLTEGADGIEPDFDVLSKEYNYDRG